MEPDGRYGSRESDPMLGPRQSGDSDAGDRPSRPGNQLQASQPARRAGFFVFLLLCTASAILLAGFVSFQFTQHQQVSSPNTGESAANEDHGHGAVTLSSEVVTVTTPVPTTASSSTTTLALASATPTASPNVQAPDLGVAPTEQFDLGRKFAVADKPMLREYVFNITRGTGAPDGLEKSMILVNGQSPGPLIEANTGDTIRVLVNNMMASDSTTIHWHGIDQRSSSWMDGVNGVTQCGIPPGESFTYEFNLTDQRGSFWYHSHVSVQYADGLYGPLIVHDPTEQVPVVDDDKIIMIGDLFHQPAERLLTEYLGKSPPWSSSMPGMEPPPANLLFNGRHILNCSAAGATSGSCTGGSRFSTHVRSGDRVRMRLISHSSSTPFLFTIDNHTLEIVEVDGVEIDPIATTRVYLNPGQRYSVLINATREAGNYRMRAAAAKNCFHLPHSEAFTAGLAAIDYQVTGILSYDDTAIANEPLGEPWNLRSLFNVGVGDEPWKSVCQDLPFDLAKPRRGRDAYSVGPKNMHYFKYRMRTDEGVWRTFINDTKYAPLKDDAALWKVLQLNASSQHSEMDLTGFDFGPGQHVLVSPDATTGAQIVINSEHMMGHPWHLQHPETKIDTGQTFQIVGWGKGAFEQSNTQWNFENPLRRDTVTVPGSSHVVIRLLADNPGVWALHCHIQWHAEGGMFLSIANRMEELRTTLQTLEDSGSMGKGIMRKFCSAGPV
ncbi:hypothetical protein GQ53DRAFT_744682 [Thozetella sp. PMI_491]|nr:hypothetical protein GQ53DRAFT_744682 [Thozetella sp. PMI_491]